MLGFGLQVSINKSDLEEEPLLSWQVKVRLLLGLRGNSIFCGPWITSVSSLGPSQATSRTELGAEFGQSVYMARKTMGQKGGDEIEQQRRTQFIRVLRS